MDTRSTWARIRPTPWLGLFKIQRRVSTFGDRTCKNRGYTDRNFTSIADGAGMCTPMRARRGSKAHVSFIISTYTFWRFIFQIPLTNSEMKIKYSINDGMEMEFFVPGRSETMRLAAYSVSDPAASPSISVPTKPISVVQRVQRWSEPR